MFFSFTKSLIFIMLFHFFSTCYASTVKLRPHQSYPIDFLEKRKDQKGLIIYHGLGTGKTFLSLAFTEKYPDKDVVILLPRFLKSNWEIQMKTYGLKNKSRYKLVSFREADTLLKHDFKNSIVVIDEVHKLVDLMTSSKGISSHDYGKLYFKLRKAHKILALTGTPIYNSSFDIAYVANLVAGKNILSFTPEKFKERYTRINSGKSLFRGYVGESKLVMSLLPIMLTVISLPFGLIGGVSALALPLGPVLGTLGIFLGNEINPAGTVEFRRFDSKKLTNFTKNYISFHEVSQKNQEFYPDKIINNKWIHYNSAQSNFFLEFVDEALEKESLRTFLMDDPEGKMSDEYLSLNSVHLQKKFLQNPTVGREIGNLAIYEPTDEERRDKGIYFPYRVDKPNLKHNKTKLIEPSKFEEIYTIMQRDPGQVAVYSNYFSNGILQFSHFLKRKGFKDFVILSPEDTVETQIKTINRYNEGKVRAILLHPEITEGVSLLATEQFHILEPVANAALLEQVIGRSVRFNSHAKLPKERREVEVYLWKAYISYCHLNIFACLVPSKAGFIRKEHWQRRFSEINSSNWTHGIDFVDRNNERKEETPDVRVERNSHLVESEMNAFKELVRKNSIESLRN